MAQALKTHGVVPDVIDTVPPAVLKVTYPNNLAVEIGKELTPTQVKDQPTVKWDAEAAAYYTLCMTGKTQWTFFLLKSPKFSNITNNNIIGNLQWNANLFSTFYFGTKM